MNLARRKGSRIARCAPTGLLDQDKKIVLAAVNIPAAVQKAEWLGRAVKSADSLASRGAKAKQGEATDLHTEHVISMICNAQSFASATHPMSRRFVSHLSGGMPR